MEIRVGGRPRDVGGAVVLRRFQDGDVLRVPNTPTGKMTAEEVARMRPANRSSLIDKGFLVLTANGATAPAAGAEKKERFLIPAGFGRFHVVEGVVITPQALTKREANRLKREVEI